MNIAIVRLYAATTHWMPDSPASNSRWMSGIATFTIIASTKIMNNPRPVATSTQVPCRRRRRVLHDGGDYDVRRGDDLDPGADGIVIEGPRGSR